MKRRRFLTTAAAFSAASSGLLRVRGAEIARAAKLIDTNVHVSPWAVRHSQPDTPARVLEKLRQHGVSSAWAGTFEAVLHTDVAGANARLADACTRHGAGVLRAFGTVNPAFPDWEEDLRRCHEIHRMPGIRLYPNYHAYGLDDPRFGRLLELATRRRLLVQIVVSIEDDRSQNPQLAATPVPLGPLAEQLEKVPGARVMLLNGGSRVLGAANSMLGRLLAAGVGFEIATLEGVAGIEALLKRHPEMRLCFGSHVPYFYFESALLKLQESDLSPAQLAAVMHGHAESALR